MSQFWPPRPRQQFRGIAISGTDVNVTFPAPFLAVPVLQVTAIRAPNPNVVVVDIAVLSTTGFTFNTYTLGGALVTGYTVHWEATAA